MKILYISGKREKEIMLLSYLSDNARCSYKHIKLDSRSLFSFSFIKKIFIISNILKKYSPDVILLEGPELPKIFMVIFKKIYKVPIAVRVKGDIYKVYAEINNSPRIFNKLKKLFNYKSAIFTLNSADAILPISENIAKVLVDNLKTAKPMYIVNTAFPKLTASVTKESLAPDIDSKDFFLTVTNFNFWSKVKPLISAIKQIEPILKRENMYWVLLGDGFFLKRFKIEVESEISSGVIKILGRKNPNSFYKKAKALFYISGMDGLPNVLLEALLFKLPIIMDKYCPAVEFFNNGSVRITNFNDKFCLQDTIRLIIQDYSQFKKMSEKAYLDYRDRFSVRNVSRQLEGALSAVIKLPYE